MFIPVTHIFHLTIDDFFAVITFTTGQAFIMVKAHISAQVQKHQAAYTAWADSCVAEFAQQSRPLKIYPSAANQDFAWYALNDAQSKNLTALQEQGAA
jgi:hypothetical protein